jgi:ribosome biogenesis GTPase / thiamine phosphate phosphatase
MGRRKGQREKDITTKYLSGDLDEDRMESGQRFGDKTKHFQNRKIERTAQLRVDEGTSPDLAALPIARVVQVYSLFSTCEFEGRQILCTVRKTLHKLRDTSIVVGDYVRIRSSFGSGHARSDVAREKNEPEAVVEDILPRKTVLTRADSFKAITQHPIVANAQQMLIVASLHSPEIKWGLIDRMVIAARAGNLLPILCLNKIDTASGSDLEEAQAVLDHYETMDVSTIKSSVKTGEGLEAVREILRGKETVLAGHSGVGKSSLINAIQPSLDLRVGEISSIHNKGKHTTTSARIFPLEIGGAVIDTPGVKLFGLWQITRENLTHFFPDLANGTAPEWRVESYQRILDSLR